MNNLNNNSLILSMLSALTAIVYAGYLTVKIKGLPTGTEKMKAIAEAIAEGAGAYLKRQYSVVAVFAALISAILFWGFGRAAALSFLAGATASALAGFAGMRTAVLANIRVAQTARKGLSQAMEAAVAGGAVTGLLVAGLALLAVSGIFSLFVYSQENLAAADLTPLVALGFGGSLISLFARIGGGIYTKGADVGTDLVGKIEAGIPEDDPRNPGVIADLVGDNVGDDAGMAADLFETYVVAAVSAMLLGQLSFPGRGEALILPLVIGAIAVLASIAAIRFIKVGKAKDGSLPAIMPALYKGLLAAMAISAVSFKVLGSVFSSVLTAWPILLIGLLVTLGMTAITEFFTSKKFSPVKKIALASETGHGTNIIAGLSLSMKSTFLPVILIAGASLTAYSWGGLYGVSLAAMSMLSLTGIVVTIDAFGPITDNAGGIAEMAQMPKKVRRITDALDAVGNTTKAITKAYAVASAGLAALVLFAAYSQELSKFGSLISFRLSDPRTAAGLFIGGSLPYLFASLTMEAVGAAAGAVVVEVRRQFKEIKGLMTGEAKAEYGRCVDIVTQKAIKEMLLPASLPVLAPIIVGLTLGPAALGGMLMGVIVTGLFVAISMTTGGAAWDNAKKYIEEGHLGGKGTLAHQAAVTGDTVGDPYKDTAGPAINPMIKVVNIVALLLAPFF